MGTQQITEKIRSDAQAEAQAIIRGAEEKAAKILADASAYAEESRKTAELEAFEKKNSIMEKRAADARLDCAKAFLGEKRKVVDAVYDEALSRLLELNKEDCLLLTQRLLERYAEKGDELFFAANYPYKKEAAQLPIVKEKELIVSEQYLSISGGVQLRGKVSDKDLSYAALLQADRDENQAALAAELFK
jgi:V/A-type H+-transporting ATPase subunit E